MSGYTGYLTSNGTDLSSVFMNINGYEMISYTGTSTQSVYSGVVVFSDVSCSLIQGTYIISISTYNTNTATGTYVMRIGISTTSADSNVSTDGFETSTISLSLPTGGGYIVANCTQVLNVSNTQTFYLNQKITFTGTPNITLDKSRCFIRAKRIA
jgi:hypothetical protein